MRETRWSGPRLLASMSRKAVQTGSRQPADAGSNPLGFTVVGGPCKRRERECPGCYDRPAQDRPSVACERGLACLHERVGGKELGDVVEQAVLSPARCPVLRRGRFQ